MAKTRHKSPATAAEASYNHAGTLTLANLPAALREARQRQIVDVLLISTAWMVPWH